jgi:hypothetical protein
VDGAPLGQLEPPLAGGADHLAGHHERAARRIVLNVQPALMGGKEWNGF